MKKSVSFLLILTCLFSIILFNSCESDESYVPQTNQYDNLNNIDSLNSPSVEYIVDRLKNVESIIETEIAEESSSEKESSGLGNAVSRIYFSSSLIDQSQFDDTSVYEKGTVCGGCIEIFTSIEDAEFRNNYLADFDGSVLDSGSHVIVGTIVIRTSSKLSKDEQKSLESSIVNALTSSENNVSKNYHTEEKTVKTTNKPTEKITEQITEKTTKKENITTERTTLKHTESPKPTESKTVKQTEKNTTKSTVKHNNNLDGNNSVIVPSKSETDGNLVWVPTNGGTKYHTHSGCSNMEDPIQVSIETAKRNGYEACGRCY